MDQEIILDLVDPRADHFQMTLIWLHKLTVTTVTLVEAVRVVENDLDVINLFLNEILFFQLNVCLFLITNRNKLCFLTHEMY